MDRTGDRRQWQPPGGASRTAAVLVATVVAVVAVVLLARPGPAPELKAGIVLASPQALPRFSLQDERGEPFGREALEGRWSLVFTGFTHCPDACPTTLALFAQLRQRVPRGDLQFMFLSVDPERDTPQRMASYLRPIRSGLLGATGSRQQVERLTTSMGLAQVRNPGSGGEYLVDHATALVLIDPRARIAGYFRAPHDAAALAADLEALPKGG